MAIASVPVLPRIGFGDDCKPANGLRELTQDWIRPRAPVVDPRGATAAYIVLRADCANTP